jgi:hypothetical protein
MIGILGPFLVLNEWMEIDRKEKYRKQKHRK